MRVLALAPDILMASGARARRTVGRRGMRRGRMRIVTARAGLARLELRAVLECDRSVAGDAHVLSDRLAHGMRGMAPRAGAVPLALEDMHFSVTGRARADVLL